MQVLALVEKGSPPAPQGFGVVAADIFQVNGFQVAGTAHGLLHGGDTGEKAARENIALDKIDITFGLLITPVIDGNGLNQRNAIGFQ